jgi:outer membrane receptor for ferrienterochelin and colicins
MIRFILHILVGLSLGLLTFSGNAQVTFQVSDSKQQPLAGAHIILKQASGKPFGGSTGQDGVLHFAEVPTGELLVAIHYLGFTSQYDTIVGAGSHRYALEVDPQLLKQFVVTAQFDPSDPDKALHKIKVIDRKTMTNMGAVTLKDVLQQQSNVRVEQDAVLGSSLTIQGLQGQHVKILIDGVPVIGRLDGSIDLSQINLNNIERVEIVEGPLSVEYGTDALAGTINLISKRDTANTWSLSGNSYYESSGQYNVDLAGSLARKKQRLTLTGGRSFFDGWSPNDNSFSLPRATLADTNRTQQWNPKKQYFGKAEWLYTAKSWSIRPFASYFSEVITNRGAPRLPYYETAFDDRYLTIRTDLGVELNKQFKKENSVQLLLSYNNYWREKNTFYTDLTTLQQSLAEDPSSQDTSKFFLYKARGVYKGQILSEKLRYQLGLDLNQESAVGKRLENQAQTLGDYGAFGTLEWKVSPELNLRTGLRWSYNTGYQAPVVPSVNAHWHKGKWQIRTAYARGFRAPSLKELYFEFVDINHNIFGNPDLKAEYADHVNLNIKRKQASGQATLSTEISVFYNKVENLISLAQAESGTRFLYFNIGEFRSLGAQGELQYRRQKAQLTVSGGYTGLSNDIDASAAIPSYSFTPEGRAQLQVELGASEINANVFYRYIGARSGYQLSAGDIVSESRIAAYDLLDFNLNRRFATERVHIGVGVKNIFNVTSIAVSGSSGGTHNLSTGTAPISWGRTFFINLGIDLKQAS